jgi:hypothetical protein
VFWRDSFLVDRLPCQEQLWERDDPVPVNIHGIKLVRDGAPCSSAHLVWRNPHALDTTEVAILVLIELHKEREHF